MEERENVELELFLVRHGESMGNVGISAGGNAMHGDDPPLTEKGLLQARLLGEYYSRLRFDCVLASGLTRAAQTAAAVSARQTGPGAATEIHPLFTECGVAADYGVKTIDELRTFVPGAVPAAGLTGAENFVHTPGREPDEARFARAKAALAYLRGRFFRGERILLAGHGAFNTVFLFAALGMDEAPAFDVAVDNTGVSKLVFYKPGTGPYDADVHLIFHNDHTHLTGYFDDELLNAVK